MKVLVAGGTGMLGVPLVKELLKRRNTVIVLGRSEERVKEVFGLEVQIATWDSLDAAILEDVSAVVNLCGENVGAGLWWTPTSQAEILASRVSTARKLAELVAQSRSSVRLLSASGVSIYADSDSVQDEHTPLPAHPDSFLADVSIQWEAAARALLAEAQCVFLRIGVVLAAGRGALGKMELPFRLGLGGRLGRGTQFMSWTSLADAVAAIVHILDRPALHGPFNIVGGRARQIDFATELASALWRPCFVPAPSFALHALLGESMANDLLLKSVNVKGTRLEESGFTWRDTDLRALMQSIYRE
mmetsp:Transcript_25344/g.49147  ORF Transcript_25344/g.49147 Transcript_25344/m.49147 type:complete len:303 (-) Transcript_25344:266-1174(-)